MTITLSSFVPDGKGRRKTVDERVSFYVVHNRDSWVKDMISFFCLRYFEVRAPLLSRSGALGLKWEEEVTIGKAWHGISWSQLKNLMRLARVLVIMHTTFSMVLVYHYQGLKTLCTSITRSLGTRCSLTSPYLASKGVRCLYRKQVPC